MLLSVDIMCSKSVTFNTFLLIFNGYFSSLKGEDILYNFIFKVYLIIYMELG